MDIPAYLKTEDYNKAVIQEGTFWGDQSEEALKYGIPFRVDYRLRTKIQRSKFQGEYEDDPELFDIVMGREFTALMKLILKHATKHRQVLELGCGPGGLALEIARNGMQVTGIDISEKSLKIAEYFKKNNKFTHGFGSLTYIQKDLNLMQFDAESKYDVVYSNGGLHHILHFEKLIRKIIDVMNDDGYLIFYDNIGETKLSKCVRRLFEVCINNQLPRRQLVAENINICAQQTRSLFINNPASKNTNNHKIVPIDSPSPFEGVTTSEILEIIPRYMKVEYEYRCQSFIKIVAHYIYYTHSNNRFTYILVSLLKKLDRLICFLRISKGENVLIVARKAST
jgi:2-polyprenyl-3-methyl-5-hydroxy-6-metoxy-1,4-benzoquinol methylase